MSLINQKRTSKIEVRVYLVKTNDERNGLNKVATLFRFFLFKLLILFNKNMYDIDIPLKTRTKRNLQLKKPITIWSYLNRKLHQNSPKNRFPSSIQCK
jgi:hypothetical protein